MDIEAMAKVDIEAILDRSHANSCVNDGFVLNLSLTKSQHGFSPITQNACFQQAGNYMG